MVYSLAENVDTSRLLHRLLRRWLRHNPRMRDEDLPSSEATWLVSPREDKADACASQPRSNFPG